MKDQSGRCMTRHRAMSIGSQTITNIDAYLVYDTIHKLLVMTPMIHWEKCKKDFRWDGSLGDIYITPALLSDWQALYPLLRDSPGTEYSVDGVVQLPPDSIEQAFAARASASPMLRVKVDRATVVFHFFSEDEVECDFDPRQIASQADLNALLGFIKLLGDATNKRVVITPENAPTEPFISYEPDTKDFQHYGITA
jgi:hypothetical protein